MADLPQHPIEQHHNRIASVMLVTAAVLIIGWPIAICVNWEHIVTSHTRLGYLIADIGLVSPLCLLSWHGLKKARTWGPLVLLATLGALAYDAVHFGVYLIQEQFLSIPLIAYVALILLVLAVLCWIGIWEIQHQTP